MLIPIFTCCGKFSNYVQGGFCLIAEMKDQRARSRILALAEDNEILVPTCNGAYVPAKIAFKEGKRRDSGGL
jgi:hypothetical protein